MAYTLPALSQCNTRVGGCADPNHFHRLPPSCRFQLSILPPMYIASDPVTTARLYYIGTSIILVSYGIFFTLTVICLHYLLAKARWNWILLGYTVASLLATSTFMTASTKYAEVLLIQSTVDPTNAAKMSNSLDLAEQVVYLIQIWLADSLLIYRLWVIWEGNFAVIVIPCILFVGSFSSGIVGVALFHQQDEKHKQIIKFAIGFHTVSLALNVIATALIAGRLLRQSRITRELNIDHGRQYISLMAIFAESMTLYTVSGLIFIPLLATGNPLAIVFGVVFAASASIAPILILLRMALGVAFERHHGDRQATRPRPVSLLSFATRRMDNRRHKSEDIRLVVPARDSAPTLSYNKRPRSWTCPERRASHQSEDDGLQAPRCH